MTSVLGGVSVCVCVCVCVSYLYPSPSSSSVCLYFNMKVQTEENIGKLCWERACQLRLIVFKLFDFRAPLYSSKLSRTQKKCWLYLLQFTVFEIIEFV